jgi:hypothetical protein
VTIRPQRSSNEGWSSRGARATVRTGPPLTRIDPQRRENTQPEQPLPRERARTVTLAAATAVGVYTAFAAVGVDTPLQSAGADARPSRTQELRVASPDAVPRKVHAKAPVPNESLRTGSTSHRRTHGRFAAPGRQSVPGRAGGGGDAPAPAPKPAPSPTPASPPVAAPPPPAATPSDHPAAPAPTVAPPVLPAPPVPALPPLELPPIVVPPVTLPAVPAP